MANAAVASASHPLFVRVTHWFTFIAFLALLLSGMEIVISHPRFYWGEDGNSAMPAAFQIPIPASRGTVPTGYNYTLPDQNGWSRALHFQSAWLLVFTGATYLLGGLGAGHFLANLIGGRGGYNPLQRGTYLFVVFGLFPVMIWTGLAMSPAFTAAFPATVTILGGRQTARTLHFFASLSLVLFVVGHVVMVIRAGFGERTMGMITGGKHEVTR